MEHETELLEKIANEDWTPILSEVVQAALGSTVNVRDHRLERDYTGTLCNNNYDQHSTQGYIILGCGVSFSVEEVIAVEVYFTKGGLMYDIQVDNI